MSTKIEQLDLPIHRGKSIKTKQYVEGYLKTCTDTGANVYWIQTKDWVDYQVEPETLSISFSGMLDNENNRIFASLTKSGKGGDLVELLEGSKETMLCLMFKGRASYKDYVGRTHWWQHYDKVKVIGIQE